MKLLNTDRIKHIRLLNFCIEDIDTIGVQTCLTTIYASFYHRQKTSTWLGRDQLKTTLTKLIFRTYTK